MKTKLIGFFVVVLGLFLFTGITHASTTEIIQPASIVYNENMTVNGELGVTSLRVGSEGVGGVTYFNGSIINVGENIPVTIADDLRIDGLIWRGPSLGQADNQALKFGDSLRPLDTNAFNLGFADKRWKDLYLAGYLYGEDMVVGRELWGGTRKGIAKGDDPLFVSDSIYPTLDDINDLGSGDNRWNDLYLSGILQGNNAKFSGLLEGENVKFTGDVDLSEANVTGLSISGDYLPLTGGTLSGLLTVDATLRVKDGGYASGGVSLTDSGEIFAAGDLTVDGDIIVGGTVDGVDVSTLSSGPYLPLAGGTMSDDIEMDNHSLNDVNTITINASVNAQTINGSNYQIGSVQSDSSTVNGTLRILPYDVAPYTCADNFTKGMLWFDNVSDELKVCDGSDWVALH